MIGNIPDGWRFEKISEIFTLKQGKHLAVNDLHNEGYDVYGANGIIGKYNQYMYEDSKVLITCRGATCGSINISKPKSWVTGNAIALVDKKDDIDDMYVAYFFKKDKLESVITGSAQPQIVVGSLSKKKIPIPPLPLQEKIVKVLDISSALIEKQKELIAEYDLFLKSKFFEMFGDPMLNNLNWGYKSFSEIAHCRLGKMVDKKQNIGKEKFIYLANLNVQWGYFKLKELRKMYFSDDEKIEFSLKKGDLLICEGGEIGRTAIWKEEIENCYFQKALHRCRVDKSIVSPEYIAHFMLHMIQSGGLFKYIVSATIPHLTGVKLKKINIPIPPIDLQNKFSSIVEKVETIKNQETQKLEYLQTLHKSLMDKAFKGEIG